MSRDDSWSHHGCTLPDAVEKKHIPRTIGGCLWRDKRGTASSELGKPYDADALRQVRVGRPHWSVGGLILRTLPNGYAGSGLIRVREAVSCVCLPTGTHDQASIELGEPSSAHPSQQVRANRPHHASTPPPPRHARFRSGVNGGILRVSGRCIIPDHPKPAQQQFDLGTTTKSVKRTSGVNPNSPVSTHTRYRSSYPKQHII